MSTLAGVVSPVFVGRQAELRAAQELVDATSLGDSGLLLVAGEAGVGKSWYVEVTNNSPFVTFTAHVYALCGPSGLTLSGSLG